MVIERGVDDLEHRYAPAVPTPHARPAGQRSSQRAVGSVERRRRGARATRRRTRTGRGRGPARRGRAPRPDPGGAPPPGPPPPARPFSFSYTPDAPQALAPSPQLPFPV